MRMNIKIARQPRGLLYVVATLLRHREEGVLATDEVMAEPDQAPPDNPNRYNK